MRTIFEALDNPRGDLAERHAAFREALKFIASPVMATARSNVTCVNSGIVEDLLVLECALRGLLQIEPGLNTRQLSTLDVEQFFSALNSRAGVPRPSRILRHLATYGDALSRAVNPRGGHLTYSRRRLSKGTDLGYRSRKSDVEKTPVRTARSFSKRGRQ